MNIVDKIALRAAAERPAIVADGLTVSYGELLSRVSHIADHLRALAAFRSEQVPRVGLACASGVDYIVLALAILKAGGCLVPLADEQTDAEREDLVNRTALAGILIHPSAAWRPAEAVVLDDESGASWMALEGGTKFGNEEEFQALAPAFVRFSSGTTGRSKGVVLSHRGLAARIAAANAALSVGPGDRVLWMLPMAHHFAVSIVLYLYHGACTVLAGSHLADAVLDTARRERCTVIYGAPFHFAMLAAGDISELWPELRLAVSTAAPLPREVAQSFFKRFGQPLVQGLGIIEVGLPLLNLSGARDAPDAVGRPLPAYDVELRDEEGRPVAAGNVGELWIKGPGMFDAYLAPWQSAEEILVDGWFATGDLAITDAAGRIFIRGRKHSVINVGGMKVFPEEVEAVMLKHPGVSACRVTGAPHRVLGAVPVAEVVPSTVPEPEARDLAVWCRRSLSSFKIPVRFHWVEKLELTASGKVRRI